MLYALRRRGQATADDIARQLDMTASGARQHLAALVDEGLAEATERPRPAGQRGRPQLAYTVTDKADGLFPKAYGELTNELLGYVAGRRRRTGRHAVRAAPRRADPQRDRTPGEVPQPEGQGRRAHAHPRRRRVPRDVRRDRPGGFRIIEHNCAIWAVAQRYGQACTSEIDFIRTVLPGASVERVQHMVAGAPHCAYEVRPSR